MDDSVSRLPDAIDQVVRIDGNATPRRDGGNQVAGARLGAAVGKYAPNIAQRGFKLGKQTDQVRRLQIGAGLREVSRAQTASGKDGWIAAQCITEH
jgi:hypothetical protein